MQRHLVAVVRLALDEGSRRKLVTSSLESVRAALNDAAERMTKSSGVWQAGFRSKIRAAIPARPMPPTKVPMMAA